MRTTLLDEPIELRDEMGEPTSDNYRDVTESLQRVTEQMTELATRNNALKEGLNDEDEKKFDALQIQQRKLIKQRKHFIDSERSSARSFNVDARVEGYARRSFAARRLPMHIRSRNGMKLLEQQRLVARPEYSDAFEAWVMARANHNSPELQMTPEETRTLTLGTDADGGYLPTQDFLGQLDQIRLQETIFRQICRVITVGTFKTNLTFEDTIASATWEAEEASIDLQSPTWGNLQLTPKKLAAIVKVSMELMQDAPSRGPEFSIETQLASQFGRGFGQVEETAFATGAGSSTVPKGLFAYTSGSTITTGVTCASTSAITAAEIVNWVYSLPRAYRKAPDVGMIVNDSTLNLVRLLANAGSFGYLWQPSFQEGEPDRILGIPVYACLAAPSFGAGNVVGVIGDMSKYVIAQRMGMSIQYLRELYAGNGQVGFLAMTRVDAGVTIRNAFRYIKAAAS